MKKLNKILKVLRDEVDKAKAPRPKKHKKKWHTFTCEVKGHFLHERQRVLFKVFKDNYDKEIDDVDETSTSNCIEFIEEPNNKHDANAIAIHVRGYGQIGYVPRVQTKELRETIHLEDDFKSYLNIYKSDKEYFADLLVEQKY